jgi:hypothetical protein
MNGNSFHRHAKMSLMIEKGLSWRGLVGQKSGALENVFLAFVQRNMGHLDRDNET